MGLPLTISLSLALCAAGCADALVEGKVRDLQKRLEETQRRSAASDRKVEDLEDRVFLLTDQVESQKLVVARGMSAPPALPRLPVVTLRPGEEAAAEGGSDVEFRGEASRSNTDTVRPVLHLEGSSQPSSASVGRAPVRPASHAVVPEGLPTENLGVAPAPSLAGARPSDNPLRLYRAAYEDLKAGRHEVAASGFRDFVKRFPRHDYADNAQYWLGECFYDRQRFAEAAAEFRTAVARYPLGNKAPDALLKLGFSLLQLGDKDKGRELLGEVPVTYPRTEAARLAEQRLVELRSLGGSK